MIALSNNENNQIIGAISKDQLGFIVEQLEEEDSKDQGYYVNRDTLELLKKTAQIIS